MSFAEWLDFLSNARTLAGRIERGQHSQQLIILAWSSFRQLERQWQPLLRLRELSPFRLEDTRRRGSGGADSKGGRREPVQDHIPATAHLRQSTSSTKYMGQEMHSFLVVFSNFVLLSDTLADIIHCSSDKVLLIAISPSSRRMHWWDTSNLNAYSHLVMEGLYIIIHYQSGS